MTIFKNGETQSRYKESLVTVKLPHTIKSWHNESHLHSFKPVADPEGNRAERRRANKLRKKK